MMTDHGRSKSAPSLLDGKVAIITGAGRGLGAETARHLAAMGAKVVVNFLRNESAATEVVESITAAGGSAFAFQADVRDADAVSRMVAITCELWGAPDILVLNADVGGFRPTPFDQLDLADYRARSDNELSAAIVPIKVLHAAMRERGSGCILAISSALCRTPVTGFSLIAVSKAALEGLMRALAVEFGPLGIRVNTIEASMIDGDNSGVVPDEQRQWVKRAVPLGRVAQANDVAGVVALIASDAAGFINGATIPVNGGQVLY